MAVVARYMILSMLLLMSTVEGRILSLNSSDDHLISDGIKGQDPSVTSNLSSCYHQYGFMPCAESAAGYFFLILVYQVLLIIGDKLMATGSVVIPNGVVIRVLRALPSMTLLIVTGILSDKESAQAQVSVVVGVYAGITVFSLTAQWCLCMVYASNLLRKKSNEDSVNCFQKQKLCILIAAADDVVNVDENTRRVAKIMLLSLIPYVVLQLIYAFDTSSGKRIVTLIALLVSFSSLILYFVYQSRNPWMVKRSLEYSKLVQDVGHHVEQLGDLVKENKLNTRLIKSIFDKAYKDGERCIPQKDLEKLVSEVFKAGSADDINQNEAIKNILNELDSNKDGMITEDEFISGIENWTNEVSAKSKQEGVPPGKGNYFISIFQMLLGIAMLTFLAGPLMANIIYFSNTMNLPSFAVSFVVVPLAMNGRAALEAILPAAQRRQGTSSRTFSEIYAGVIMNNIAGLTTLLAIVFLKDLRWDFSAEVLSIMAVCFMVGTHAYRTTTYRLWTCIPVFLLYPISLALFYFSQVFFGWN